MRDHGIAVPGDLLAAYPEAPEIFVAREGALLGAIVLADSVRPEPRQAIDAIHVMPPDGEQLRATVSAYLGSATFPVLMR
jgi:hypothetical protein